jgi:ABC-type dipeptide/oligopeptide/nickel transport system ATPase component
VLPGQEPPGCPFEPRCTFALDACRAGVPPHEPIAHGRTLACVISPDLSGADR